LQATYGMQVDAEFENHWRTFVAADMPCLSYHFLHGALDGYAQAMHHLVTVKPMWEAQGFKMPCFMDIEAFGYDTATNTQRIKSAKDWAAVVAAEVCPGVYSNVKYWGELMNNTPLLTIHPDMIGWAAHWTSAAEPMLPAGWPKEEVLFWQYGIATRYPWCPPVPGMASDVDVNYFLGDLPGLYSLGELIEPPPPPPSGEPTHADIMAKLDEIIELLEGGIIPEPEPPTPPDPDPEPDPEPVGIPFKITATKTNLRFTKASNANGAPIMQIYPSDTSLASERIQRLEGDVIRIVTPAVTADGGARYFEVVDVQGRGGETLYVRKDDGTQIASVSQTPPLEFK